MSDRRRMEDGGCKEVAGGGVGGCIMEDGGWRMHGGCR